MTEPVTLSESLAHFCKFCTCLFFAYTFAKKCKLQSLHLSVWLSIRISAVAQAGIQACTVTVKLRYLASVKESEKGLLVANLNVLQMFSSLDMDTEKGKLRMSNLQSPWHVVDRGPTQTDTFVKTKQVCHCKLQNCPVIPQTVLKQWVNFIGCYCNTSTLICQLLPWTFEHVFRCSHCVEQSTMRLHESYSADAVPK